MDGLKGIIAGPASSELGAKIASALGWRLIPLEFKTFPDGESYIRIDWGDFEGSEVVIVQSTHPPQDRHLMQLFLMADAARDAGMGVEAVVPYLAYSRQDKMFRAGEAVSVVTVCKLMRCAGIRKLFVLDVHSEEALARSGIPAKNITAMFDIGKYFLGKELRDPIVVSPDEGAKRHAEEVAGVLGCEASNFRKERDRITGEVSVTPSGARFSGRDVVLVDDMISTGGSMLKAMAAIRAEGPHRIFVACTHPLLGEGVGRRLLEAGAEEIVGTDSFPNPFEKVSVANAIAEALRSSA
ncbi:MAG: ribose-phosphate diphosphokinase [Candidatus Bathyarchaeia archaeon]